MGALATLAVASSISTAIFQRQEYQASRNEAATAAVETLRSTMRETLAGLRGAGAIVGSGGDLDLAAFASFARGLSVQPGLSALALEPVVHRDERRAFERQTGLQIVDRRSAGDFVPSPVRDFYYPVLAVVPETPETRSILGFDIGNDPVRGPVVRKALGSGPRSSRSRSPCPHRGNPDSSSSLRSTDATMRSIPLNAATSWGSSAAPTSRLSSSTS